MTCVTLSKSFQISSILVGIVISIYGKAFDCIISPCQPTIATQIGIRASGHGTGDLFRSVCCFMLCPPSIYGQNPASMRTAMTFTTIISNFGRCGSNEFRIRKGEILGSNSQQDANSSHLIMKNISFVQWLFF